MKMLWREGVAGKEIYAASQRNGIGLPIFKTKRAVV
jgi:hypothetical protein